MPSSILETLNIVELKKRKKDLQIQIKKINNELEKHNNISTDTKKINNESEKYKNNSTDTKTIKITIKKK